MHRETWEWDASQGSRLGFWGSKHLQMKVTVYVYVCISQRRGSRASIRFSKSSKMAKNHCVLI